MDKAKKSLEQIEAEKLSRRQALGRIGFLAGASAVAALTSDELLRKVGAEMQRRAGDNKVVNQVAKEFQATGMSFASNGSEDDDLDNPCKGCGNCTPSSTTICLPCGGNCGENKKRSCAKCSSVSSGCGNCCTDYQTGFTNCNTNFPPPSQENLDCMQTVTNTLKTCLTSNNCNGSAGSGCGTCACG